MSESSRLIIALDNMTFPDMISLAEKLEGKVWGFKVNDALIAHGTVIVRELKKIGRVFADPKLYDIPNTVANAVYHFALAGADLISVHASGGEEMVAKACETCPDRILAVTVLTSMSSDDVAEVYGKGNINDKQREITVRRLAKIAQKSKCWGVVCAAADIQNIPAGVRTVIPGFRPQGNVAGDDQKHTADFDSVQSANLIVVGRPVTKADDPVAVVEYFNSRL